MWCFGKILKIYLKIIKQRLRNKNNLSVNNSKVVFRVETFIFNGETLFKHLLNSVGSYKNLPGKDLNRNDTNILDDNQCCANKCNVVRSRASSLLL